MKGAYIAHNRKLTFAIAELIRRDRAAGDTVRVIAARYECDRNSVNAILDGRTYLRPARYEQPAPDPKPYRMPPLVADDPRSLCRIERAKRLHAPRPVMDDAKRALQAVLARECEARKGGRPGKPKILAIRTDPADALVTALSEWKNPKW